MISSTSEPPIAAPRLRAEGDEPLASECGHVRARLDGGH
jgi:hypothetical protein